MTFLSTALAEDTAAQTAPSWLQTAFGDFSQRPVWGWIVLAVLLVGGFIAYRVLKPRSAKTVWNTKMMALGAVCIALGSVLSMVKLWAMPMGGSVTPGSMLPLMLFAYIYGAGPGILVGVVYGVLQFLLDGYGLAYGIPGMLLDYPIAFGLIGLCGLMKNSKNDLLGMTCGVVIGALGRFAASFASGVAIYGIYAADYGFSSAWLYSLCYNGAYLLPDCIICVILVLLIGPRLARELRKEAQCASAHSRQG